MSIRAPRPRLTRRGEVIIGPTVWARWRPAALLGLPLIALVLSPLASAGVQEWRRAQLRDHGPTAVTDLLSSSLVQIVVAAVGLWVLLALWALVPMALTGRPVRFDGERGTLTRGRGLGRRTQRRDLSRVLWALGDPERDAQASIGLAATDPSTPVTEPGATVTGTPGDGDDEGPPEPEQWLVPFIGWDDASFDGLRVLQEQAGLMPSPPRPVLLRQARRERRERVHRELAAQIGMPWREEYVQDPALFQRDFDHARRVLAGLEPDTEGAAAADGTVDGPATDHDAARDDAAHDGAARDGAAHDSAADSPGHPRAAGR